MPPDERYHTISPKTASRGELLPLNLRKELGFKDMPGLQRLRNLASEQEPPFGEVDQNIADYFPQVHPTDHLLVPARKGGGRAQRDAAHICNGRIAAALSAGGPAHAHGGHEIRSLIYTERPFTRKIGQEKARRLSGKPREPIYKPFTYSSLPCSPSQAVVNDGWYFLPNGRNENLSPESRTVPR